MKFLSIIIIGLIGMAMLTEGYSVCLLILHVIFIYINFMKLRLGSY